MDPIICIKYCSSNKKNQDQCFVHFPICLTQSELDKIFQHIERMLL